MADEKTEILIIDSLIGKKLTKEQAEIVASRMQQNTDDIKRFVKMEAKIEDIVDMVEAIKENGIRAVKWILGLLAANYIGTFWGTLDSLL